MSGQYFQVNHPVLRHKLSCLRDKTTDTPQFRNLIHEIGALLAYEATKELTLTGVAIETPMQPTQGERISDRPIVVSILRAGIAMTEGILTMLPFASEGHIGIYRDKFINNTVEYFFKLPTRPKNRTILLTDPLVATGDTMIAALDRLKQYEVGRIKIMCILISPLALKRIHHFHPDVDIYALNSTDELDEKGYLRPGIGDVGDRLFRTKEEI